MAVKHKESLRKTVENEMKDFRVEDRREKRMLTHHECGLRWFTKEGMKGRMCLTVKKKKCPRKIQDMGRGFRYLDNTYIKWKQTRKSKKEKELRNVVKFR